MFENTTLDWSKIYLSPRLATIDTTLRSFQYKILNNALFLNRKLYTFGITNTGLCSFCKTVEETPLHIFFDCVHVKCLSEKSRMKFQNDFTVFYRHLHHRLLFLDCIIKQMTIIIFWVMLLISKYHIYTSREKWTLNIDILIANLMKVEKR